MNKKPVAVVLAGTVPHIRLLNNLKGRGYYTVLVDYYENPPAKPHADEHVRESTLDQDMVLSIAQERKAKLVITTNMDHANVTACYVAEKLGLPAPYSYETALEVTNKGMMKEKMIRNGIPTSEYIFVKDISGFEASGLRFPVAVKPADSNGSKGVRKARDLEELKPFLDDALRISRGGEAIIEEYKEGREIGVDCFIQNNQAVILMTKERRKVQIEGDPIQQIKGCIWPAPLSAANLKDLQSIAQQIALVFHLENTPLMFQCIVNGDDISIIEFAARFGGGESFRIIRLSTGVDIVDVAVNSFLGNPVTLDSRTSDCIYADNFLYARPGVFGGLVGHEDILANGTVEYIDAYKAEGMEIGEELTSNNRVGVFVAKAETMDALFDKINTTIDAIEICDVRGKPLMRKEVYPD